MNKVVLVTGASSGIGAATAILAARKGYQVLVNFNTNERGATDVVSAIQREGGSAVAMQADLSREDDVNALFKSIDARFGRLDGLVNNAGTLETQMRVEAMSFARLEKIFLHNVISVFLCSREAVKRMSTRHGGTGGSIVNVSSVASRTGSPGEYVDYAASKGAVDTFTLGLAKEVAAEGIRVNCVRPGPVYTGIHAKGGEPGRVDRVKDSIPMKRGGQVEEIAAPILWLLSDEASFTSGTFIDAAGGR